MSVIRENDEHWKDNLIGHKLDKRIEQAIHKRAQQETMEYLMGNYGRRDVIPRLHETVFVATQNKGKIQDISLNEPNDIILDNFGYVVAGLIRQPTSTVNTVPLTDTGGNARTPNLYITSAAGSVTNCNSALAGTRMQLGSGTSTPARTDYAIQTPLATAPENTFFNTGAGSYAAGVVSFSGSVTAGGSGTVNEAIFTGRWTYTGTTLADFALFHDKLAAGVSFTAGKTLTASYSINL